MSYTIESGVQLIRRKTKATITPRKPIYPLATMSVGDSIVVSKQQLVGKAYVKKYQTIYTRMLRIKKNFGIQGQFKVGLDQNNYLRILKIS